MIGVLLLCCLFVLIYFHFKVRFNYWKRRNIPCIPSSVFNIIKSMFYPPVPVFNHYANIYHKLSGEKYGGCFLLFQPQFVARDPEIIKHILTKNFEHFRDPGQLIFDKHDPVTQHVASAPGDLWKEMRVYLTPLFTPGKLKLLFSKVNECAEDYKEHFEKQLVQVCTRSQTYNFHDAGLGYAIASICSVAFNWKSDSINDPNDVFRKISEEIFHSDLRFNIVRLFVHEWLSFLRSYVPIYQLPNWIRDFFLNAVHRTVEDRMKSGNKIVDLFQLCISSNVALQSDQGTCRSGESKQHKFTTSDGMIAGQCLTFFSNGSHSVSLILNMTLLEMAENQSIQKKLQQEIDYFIDQNDNQITYEMVKDMPYLHKVVQETLRKYPVNTILTRICTKTYQVPNTNIIIEKGTEVIIPIAGMHMDETIYPYPDLFDPERFSVEEMKKRHHYSYLPFGEGPRNCLGMRFGLMVVKLGIIYILKHFYLEKTPQTLYPMIFLPKRFEVGCAAPILLKYSKRN